MGAARRHAISDEEIRNTSIPDAIPRLYIGRRTDAEPPIEVLADTASGQCVVFHAMLLRLSTLAELDSETAAILPPQLARHQRK